MAENPKLMNIKITDQAIIYKITSTEMKRLLLNEALSTTLCVGEHHLLFSFIPDKRAQGFAVTLNQQTHETHLALRADAQALQQLAASAGSHEGINLSFEQLNLSLQVDIRTVDRSLKDPCN